MFGTKLKVAAGVLAAVTVSGGLAFAAIPGPDGTIAACYTKYPGLLQPQGSLRVVDSASQCRSNETALTWNQQGQPGLPGEDGVDGVDGVDGAPGLPGADGVDGTDGAPGLPGADGVDGINGIDGIDGQNGLPGPVGPAGPPGISGARFVPLSEVTLPDSGDFVKVSGTTLPAGAYVVTASPTFAGGRGGNEETVICELRHGSGFIGGQATALPDGYRDDLQMAAEIGSLTVVGGALVGDGGGEISLWCRAEGHGQFPTQRGGGNMMILQIGGFI